MYQNLLFAVKKRILDECVGAFKKHPAFSKKVKVYHKFPYKKRVQYGMVLRSTSGSQIRMSADNYMADLVSHVRLARTGNKPGVGIEWVRENTNYVTQYVTNEDVSHMAGPTQRRFFTEHQILAGPNNTHFADNPGQIEVTVNGSPVLAEYVNGRKKIVMLASVPPAGSVVKVSYFRRVMAHPGVYVVDFTENNQFMVGAVFTVDGELVIEKADGTETTANLSFSPVYDGSLDLYLQSRNGGVPVWLIQGTDYTVDNATGLITLLTPLVKNFQLFADYQYQSGFSVGPFQFRPYQEIHDAIPGVVLSIGRRAQKGDRQLVIVSEFRESQARIYGGHWDMSLSVAVIAKDPIQMEEMSDQLVNYLWSQRKNQLEYEGITLNSVVPSGESEEPFIDTTGDLYYESSVDIDVMTEWQEFVPYFFEIKRVMVQPEVLEVNTLKNYYVSKDNKMVLLDPEPDTRRVIKYATSGYERVI